MNFATLEVGPDIGGDSLARSRHAVHSIHAVNDGVTRDKEVTHF